MSRAALALALCCFASTAPAQQAARRDHPRVREAIGLLDVWTDAQVAYQQIPAASIAVVHDQELVWSTGYGYANPETRTPATAETIYSICSISKLFTSVGVMQLRDAGKLRLDDPVGKHLAWFDIRDTYPDAPPVTIEGILTHSSGLPRESDYPYWTGPDFPFPTHDQIVARLREQAELYPARTYFQYSNLGLTLAGEVVAAVSGQAYGDYVNARILTPLGLANTTPEIPADLHGTRMAVGYSALTRDGTRQKVPVFQGRGVAPAMAFASTVQDLGAFASWQFRVLHHGADEVLGRNTLREMHRVHWVDPDWETTWGLGFGVYRGGGKTFVGHGGSCPGYRSNLQLETTERIATVFASSANGVNASAFTRQAYAIMAPALKAAADTAHAAAATPDSLRAYVGTYSELPWGGETAVVLWKGSIAMLGLPTDNPMDALTELRPTGPHTFRRVRDDGELGEEIRFDVGADGRATRMWQHSNYSPRVR